jgi:predicted Zn-dependent protease
LAGSIFFNHDTESLYFDAVRSISISKFAEAKEKLEQAISKEPGQVLVLTRLVQVELALGLKDAAQNHLKLAQASAPFSIELKLFAAKIALDSAEDDQDWYRTFSPLKQALLENEVTLTFWAEVLKRAGKTQELESLATKTLKSNPNWTYALSWFYRAEKLSSNKNPKIRAQMEKNLKDKNLFDSALEREMNRSQYYWVGYVIYEDLLNQLK